MTKQTDADAGLQINREFTREEPHALFWSKPARTIAKELGISDVALGKTCRRLSVPKPPPGYWAKVAHGKSPRHIGFLISPSNS
jgi:hypothetical protein